MPPASGHTVTAKQGEESPPCSACGRKGVNWDLVEAMWQGFTVESESRQTRRRGGHPWEQPVFSDVGI